MLDYTEGLVDKYTVTKNDTGDDVPGAFVLRPETDPMAAAALLFYADLVMAASQQTSPLLAEVEMWLQAVDDLDGPGTIYDRAVRLYNGQLDGVCKS